MSKNIRISKAMILAVSVFGIVVFGVCGLLYFWEANQIANNWRERSSSRVKFLAYFLRRDFQSITTDLRVLADGDGLRAYLSSGQKQDLDRATRRAVFFSVEHPEYDQLRYLDEQGNEILRVNQNGKITPSGQLQNKSDRPYFKNAQALNAGEIFISAFDLNVENGRVEQPFKPTIRFAVPVFDASGHHRGVYVVNVFGTNLLTRLQQFAPQYQHQLRVLNSAGYWIEAAQEQDEWGFMLPDRAGKTLAQTDPNFWSQITQTNYGQINHAGGIFTWTQVVPAELVDGNARAIKAGDKFLIIASEISASEWASAFATLRKTFLIVALILLLLGIVIVWLLAVQRRAQKKLQHSEERVRLMIESVTDYAIVMLDTAGRIMSWNDGAERIKGYGTEEIIGQNFSIFYPEKIVHSDFAKDALAAAAKDGRFENEGWRMRKNSSQFWANTIITAVRNPDRELIGFIEVTGDLTKQKLAGEQIKKLNDELTERAEQLEATNKELESFSYSVSHDLRTPVRHIDGFVKLLTKQADEKLDDAGKRYLHIIKDSARQMGALIDDLLAFSRMGRADLHRSKIASNSLVHEAIHAMQLETHGRKITWKIADLPEVDADPTMLRQVWINLIANAIKYTRPRDPAEIEIDSDSRNGEFIFFVRDNGVGFDMRYEHKLFGVFQRLHRAEEFEGTGIGLANVRRIVARHGGRTWAEGKIGAGATFFFSIPKNPTDT